MIRLENIEHCLETLAGLSSTVKFDILKEDGTIIFSIARQCFKGTALTDRQHELMKQKLVHYKPQFDNAGYIDFEEAISKLRQPLRQIDRSKYIRLEDNWIKVRFPFSKKLIMDVQSISCPGSEHRHEKGSHEHFFLFNEANVFELVTTFKDKNFTIDQEILDYYNKVCKFNDRQTYDTSIIDYKLSNVHPAAVELALQELGAPNSDNLIKYRDRSKIYGINYFDSALDAALENADILTRKIVERKTQQVFVKSSEWNLDRLLSSIHDLDRYPIVVLLDEDNPYEHLTVTHQRFRNYIDNTQISVQFRLSANKNNGFNEYIKQHRLNSPVDKHTKVVYTSMDKLNKPLLQSNCNPMTALMLSSCRLHNKISAWLDGFDLVVHYDEEISQFGRHALHRTLTRI